MTTKLQSHENMIPEVVSALLRYDHKLTSLKVTSQHFETDQEKNPDLG
jgi:hypothetical protein